MNKPVSILCSTVGLLCIGASPCSAQDWDFTAEIYALAADVSAETSFGREAGADFDDILENLEFAAFGSIAARRDRFGMIGNLFYVDLETSERNTRGPLKTKTELEMETLVATAALGWDFLAADNASLFGLVGVRYLSLDANLHLDIESVASRSSSGSSSYWDGVIGLQGRADLSDSWYLTYYADMGTGDSDFTWQATAAVSYRFEAVDVALGYQYLSWEFDDQLTEDLEIAGPAIGVRFSW